MCQEMRPDNHQGTPRVLAGTARDRWGAVARGSAPDGDDGRITSRAEHERGPRSRKRPDPGEPWPVDDDNRYELTDEDREWARHTVASLPPLTCGQRDILALLLSKRRQPGVSP